MISRIESVKNFTDSRKTLKTFNIHRQIPDEMPNEISENLLTSSSVRIERIVSRGHKSPTDFWYDQSESEWVLLVAGQARLAIDGEPEEIELGPGDYLNIPAGLRHRVTWTDPDRDTIWLAVFYS
jgi:cupin 2 domain-containing protein